MTLRVGFSIEVLKYIATSLLCIKERLYDLFTLRLYKWIEIKDVADLEIILGVGAEAHNCRDLGSIGRLENDVDGNLPRFLMNV